jgi:hypothetical protein
MFQSYLYEKINRSKISLMIGSFSLLFMIALGFYENHLVKRVDDLHQRLSALNDLAARSQETTTFIQSRREDFLTFQSCGFERPLTPEILRTSLRYPIEFGAISFLKGKLKSDKFVAQNVSFSILCLHDRDIFALLDQLANQGPGFFQIHEVTIKRVTPLSQEMLEKIADGKPQTLFDGRVIATWIHQ